MARQGKRSPAARAKAPIALVIASTPHREEPQSKAHIVACDRRDDLSKIGRLKENCDYAAPPAGQEGRTAVKLRQFDIERYINGHTAEARQATRQALAAPLIADLHRWLGEQRTRLAHGNDVARAID